MKVVINNILVNNLNFGNVEVIYQVARDKVSFANRVYISILNDNGLFDPENTDSLIYEHRENYKNINIKIYEPDNVLIYQGVVENILREKSVIDSSGRKTGTAIIHGVDEISDILSIDNITYQLADGYSQTPADDKAYAGDGATPAEHQLALIRRYLSDDQINLRSFTKATAIQEDIGLTCNVAYENTKLLTVLDGLSLDIGYLHIENSKLSLKIISAFEGQYGKRIVDSQIINVNRVEKYIDKSNPSAFRIVYDSATAYDATGTTGTTTGITSPTITDSTADYTVDEFKGKYIFLDEAATFYTDILRITGNTKTTITVDGTITATSPANFVVSNTSTVYEKDYSAVPIEITAGVPSLGSRILNTKNLNNKLKIEFIIEDAGLNIIAGDAVTMAFPEYSLQQQPWDVIEVRRDVVKKITTITIVDAILYPVNSTYALTILDAPTNLSGSRNKDGYLDIKWDAVSGANLYSIHWSSLTASDLHMDTNHTDGTDKIKDVFKWSGYFVYVTAYSNLGIEGEKSATIFLPAIVDEVGYIDGTRGYNYIDYGEWGRNENWWFALTYKVLNPDDINRLNKNTRIVLDRSQVGQSSDATNANASEAASGSSFGYLDLAGSSKFLGEFVQNTVFDSGTGASIVLTNGTGVLTDGTKSWSSNVYSGKLIRVTKNDTSSLLCLVSLNDATTITFGLNPLSGITGASISYSITEHNQIKNPYSDKALTFEIGGSLTATAAGATISDSENYFSRRWSNGLVDYSEYMTYWYSTGFQFNPLYTNMEEWYKVHRIDTTLGVFEEGNIIADINSSGSVDVNVTYGSTIGVWLLNQWTNYWLGMKIPGEPIKWLKILTNTITDGSGDATLVLDSGAITDSSKYRFIINIEPFKGFDGIFWDDVWYNLFAPIAAVQIQRLYSGLDTGTSTALGAAFMGDTTKSWTVNEMVGSRLSLDGGGSFLYVVTDNTATNVNFIDNDGSAGSNGLGSPVSYQIKSNFYDVNSVDYQSANQTFISNLVDHVEKRIRQFYVGDPNTLTDALSSKLKEGYIILNTFPDTDDFASNYPGYVNQINKNHQNFVMNEALQSTWISSNEITKQFYIKDWVEAKERFEAMKIVDDNGSNVRIATLGYPNNRQMQLSLYVGGLMLATYINNKKEDIFSAGNVVLDQIYYNGFLTRNIDGDSIGVPEGDAVALTYDEYYPYFREFNGVYLFYNPSRKFAVYSHTFGYDCADYDTGLHFAKGTSHSIFLLPRQAKVFYKENKNGNHGYIYLQQYKPYSYLDYNSLWIVFTTTGQTAIGTDSVWLDYGYTHAKRFVVDGSTSIPVGTKEELFHAGDDSTTSVLAENAQTEGSISGDIIGNATTLTSKTILQVVRVYDNTGAADLEFGIDFLIEAKDGDNTSSGKGKWDTDIYYLTDQTGNTLTAYYYEQGLDGDLYPDKDRARFEHGYLYSYARQNANTIALKTGDVDQASASTTLTKYTDYYIVKEPVKWNWEYRTKVPQKTIDASIGTDTYKENTSDIVYPSDSNKKIKTINHGIIDADNAILIETAKTAIGIGTATATTFTDSTKTGDTAWTNNQWKNGTLLIEDPNGKLAGARLAVTGNNSNTLTFSSNPYLGNGLRYDLEAEKSNSINEYNGMKAEYASKTVTRPKVLIFGWSLNPRDSDFNTYKIADRYLDANVTASAFRFEVEIQKNLGILYDEIFITGDYDGEADSVDPGNSAGAWGSVQGILDDGTNAYSTVAQLAAGIDIVIINDTFIEINGQATTTTGTSDIVSTVLTDTDQNWTGTDWTDYYVRVDGTDYIITSNTANTLTATGLPNNTNIDYAIRSYGQKSIFSSWVDQVDYNFIRAFVDLNGSNDSNNEAYKKLLIDRRLGLAAFVHWGGFQVIVNDLINKGLGSELATYAGIYSFGSVQVSALAVTSPDSTSISKVYVKKDPDGDETTDNMVFYSADNKAKFKVFNNDVKKITDHYDTTDGPVDYNVNENGGSTITYLPKTGNETYRTGKDRKNSNLYIRHIDTTDYESTDIKYLEKFDRLPLDNVVLRREDAFLFHKNDTAFQEKTSTNNILNFYCSVISADFQSVASSYNGKRVIIHEIKDNAESYLLKETALQRQNNLNFGGYKGHIISAVNANTDFAAYSENSAIVTLTVTDPDEVHIQWSTPVIDVIGTNLTGNIFGNVLTLDTYESTSTNNYMLSSIDAGIVEITKDRSFYQDAGGVNYPIFSFFYVISSIDEASKTTMKITTSGTFSEFNPEYFDVITFGCANESNNFKLKTDHVEDSLNPTGLIKRLSPTEISINSTRGVTDNTPSGYLILTPSERYFSKDEIIPPTPTLTTANIDTSFGGYHGTVDIVSDYIPPGGDAVEGEVDVLDPNIAIGDLPSGLIPYERAYANASEPTSRFNSIKEFAYEENTGFITGHAFYKHGDKRPPVILWQGVGLEDVHRLADSFIGIEIKFNTVIFNQAKDYFLYYNEFKDILQIKDSDVSEGLPGHYKTGSYLSSDDTLEQAMTYGKAGTVGSLLLDGTWLLDGTYTLNGKITT